MLNPWPYYSPDEVSAATKVLQSGLVNSWTGTNVRRFESSFSNLIGLKHSVAVSNGSTALGLAYSSLNLNPGDEVITTPRTFIATASELVLHGIKPVFADVELDSGNISARTILPLINPKTKAISVVHLAGWPCDMDPILDLCRSHKLMLVEDCSQAHGATYKGAPIGSFGDVSTWSFCQDKIISTGGEGGMVSTDSPLLFNSIWSSKDHGKSYDLISTLPSSDFRWLHHSFGSNFRLTEFQAVIGLKQLTKLEDWLSIRARNAMILFRQLSHLSNIRVPIPPSHSRHSYYKAYVYIDPSSLKDDWTLTRLITSIRDSGFPASSGSCSEIYLEKCFIDSGLSPAHRLPNASRLSEQSLMLCVHPTITIEQMRNYASAVEHAIKMATR